MVSAENIKELVLRYIDHPDHVAFIECLNMYPRLSPQQKEIFDHKVQELSGNPNTMTVKCPFSLYANYWLRAFDELTKQNPQ